MNTKMCRSLLELFLNSTEFELYKH